MNRYPAPSTPRGSVATAGHIGLAAVALGFCILARAAQPVIDNERVTVRETTGVTPVVPSDFIAVSLSHPGTAVAGRKGATAGEPDTRTVLIELKDHPVAPLPNSSGYPLAFPRPRVQKLFEDDRVIVWSYHWAPGEPTPMHFHDKDIVVVFEEDTTLHSTTPDGKSVVYAFKAGDVRFNRRDHTHSELLVGASGSAVMTELK